MEEIKIVSFIINQYRNKLIVTFDSPVILDNLYLFTAETYKTYSEGINLSSKFTSTPVLFIEINLSDLELEYFDGVYIIEAESEGVTVEAITSDLTRYKECILNKVIEFSICDSCLETKSLSVLNTNMLLEALVIAIDNGFVSEIRNLTYALNKYCSNECKSCGDYNNESNSNYYNTLQTQILG